MILSDVNYKEPYDPETLSGQLNITNATDCVVTGCYQVYTSRAGLTTIHFLPQSCVLGNYNDIHGVGTGDNTGCITMHRALPLTCLLGFVTECL